jgi:hypothetical protein
MHRSVVLIDEHPRFARGGTDSPSPQIINRERMTKRMKRTLHTAETNLSVDYFLALESMAPSEPLERLLVLDDTRSVNALVLAFSAKLVW